MQGPVEVEAVIPKVMGVGAVQGGRSGLFLNLLCISTDQYGRPVLQ